MSKTEKRRAGRNWKILFGAIALFILYMGWYPSITTTAVDAETGEPIEGAVALIQWTTTTFAYESSTRVNKSVEVESDNNGVLRIPGYFRPFTDRPEIALYKKGYVGWRHDNIFPGYERRTDFAWRSGYVFELKLFKDGYSVDKHISFLKRAIMAGSRAPLYRSALMWERGPIYKSRKAKEKETRS